MTRTLRHLLVLFGLAIVAFLVLRTGPRLVAAMLLRLGWRFAAVLAIYGLHVFVRAVALWLSVLEGPVAFADVWRVRLSGEAVEMLTLTGPFLAEPAKAWLLKGRGLTTAGAFAAVITEYLLYTVACSVLVLASLGLLLAHGAVPAQMRPAALIVIAITAGFLMLFGFASVTGIGLLVPMLRASGLLIGRQRVARAAGELRPIEDVIVRFLHTVPIRLAQVLSIELAAQLLLVVEVWTVLRGLGFSPSLNDALIIEGGAKFVGIAFAFVPGQLGALEGVSALLARAIGLPAAAGLSLALVRRVRGLLVAAGGVVALTGGVRT